MRSVPAHDDMEEVYEHCAVAGNANRDARLTGTIAKNVYVPITDEG